MKKYIIVIIVALLSFKAGEPRGWAKVETRKLKTYKAEVYFFDYFSKAAEVYPDISQFKGRAFVDKLADVHFRYPLYVAKVYLKKDTIAYYILRPDRSRKGTPFMFTIDVVKSQQEYILDQLEDTLNYVADRIKIIDAKGCRGGSIYEYNRIVQDNPDNNKLIGNGMRMTDSIITRVIPYEETANPFFRLIEADL